MKTALSRKYSNCDFGTCPRIGEPHPEFGREFTFCAEHTKNFERVMAESRARSGKSFPRMKEARKKRDLGPVPTCHRGHKIAGNNWTKSGECRSCSMARGWAHYRNITDQPLIKARADLRYQELSK